MMTASIISKADRAWSAARATSVSAPSRGWTVPDRGQDVRELAVAPLEVARQAIVALGQARQLVLAGDDGSGSTGRPLVARSTDAAIDRSGAIRSSARR